MDDDLTQLLAGLKMQKLQQTIESELAWAEASSPSYTNFLKRVLRREYTDQQERFLENRIQRAKLPERWSLKTFPWANQPGVHRGQIEQLAELDFISRGQNIVMIGPTGVGKTGLAIGLMMEALYRGYRCRFIKAQELFDEMYTSLADRSSRKLLDHLVRLDLLLIDSC